ncbi:MAG: hypothetical protein J7K21_04525 [Desulfurococcales archaeon]|nr:hypothetical protein [Desulfurococcales archaeon]
MVNTIEYYSREYVKNEIYRFLINRWAGIEGENKKWIRWIDKKPLKINKPDDIPYLIKRYRFMKPRSFYGTIEVYKKLETREDVMEKYSENVAYTTVFIDIDIINEELVEKTWTYALEAAKTITNWLIEEGVKESTYLLWSGAGVHVRIHEKAFKETIQHHHPLIVAHAVAEYILLKLKPRLLEIIRSTRGAIKIENLVVMKRVFTDPLSLHRRLERATIAFKPDDIEEFKLEWTNPENPRHKEGIWNTYKEGEADPLAWRALKAVESIENTTTLEATATKLEIPPATLPRKETIEQPREPGRFQVMALLQAARYYLLNKDLGKAKSFGPNRAIFYAWAKYYGPQRRPVLAKKPGKLYGRRLAGDEYIKWVEELGEKLQVSQKGYYVMGGVEQRPEDFDRQVARRFEEAGIDFKKAWDAAIQYISRFPRIVLKNPREFYKQVYEPVRDKFVEKVLKVKKEKKTSSLDKWVRLFI